MCKRDSDRSNLPVGLGLGMEGADPILWPEQVHEWWNAGLRVVSLAHYGVSVYAHGTGRPGGAAGRDGQGGYDPRPDPHVR